MAPLSTAAAVALLLLSSALLATGAGGKRRLVQSEVLWAHVLDGYKAQRAVTVRRESAARTAAMAKSRQVLRRLARQPPLKIPRVPPSTSVKYVDLGGRMGIVPALPTVPDFGPSYANYPRYPTAVVPVPLPSFSSCPNASSVLKFGAKGNGKANDRGALAAASASNLDYIYLPTGQYKVASNLTITKPIVAAAGAWFEVAPTATLTLTAQPRKWNSTTALFAGTRMKTGVMRKPGPIALAGNFQILPEWFKNEGDSDSDAMQQAIDACGGSCTVMLTKTYYLDKAVMLRPGLAVYSTNSLLVGNGTGEGFVLTPGTYNRPLVFGTFLYFSTFCIKVMGGVRGAELQVNGALYLNDFIRLVPDANGDISNVFLTHLSVTSEVQNTIAILATSTSQQIRNCLLRGNFILKGGFHLPAQQGASLGILGAAAPRLVGTMVVWQAVDTVQFGANTSYVWLQNAAGSPASNVVFQVQSWGGGMIAENFGRMVQGDFRGLKAMMDTAGGVPSANHMMALSGYGNLVTYGGYDTAGVEWIMPEGKPNITGFYCLACCPKANKSNCTDAELQRGRITTSQVFYVNAPISRPWLPGEIRTYYLWNVFAQTADTRLECVVFRAGNAGIVCYSFENQQTQDPGRIAIHLRNAAAYTISQGEYRFGIQVGP